MGKPGKWLKQFLTGKKKKEKVAATGIIDQNVGPVTTDNPAAPVVYPPMTPREKKRWSFRRSSGAMPAAAQPSAPNSEDEQKKHVMAVAVAATAMMLTITANVRSSPVEEAAVVKIQSAFRSYLARKALHALRGLVKLQALVRGHLVRKQAKATLRCMQALVAAQARARAQRLHVMDDTVRPSTVRPSTHHRGPSRVTGREILDRGCNDFVALMQEIDIGMTEENIKIVETDLGESRPGAKTRNSYSYPNHLQPNRTDHRFLIPCPVPQAYPYQDDYQRMSPARSAFTEMSPRMGSGHFEDYPFHTAESSPQCYSAVSKPNPYRILFSVPRPEYTESLSYDYSFYPNYMANTESSRAKARSQSMPKQRPPDYFERQTSRRRLSMEGRGVPRVTVRMQRSSSQVRYQHPPWMGMQLERSAVSLKGSESGSTTSTVMTNTNYRRSLSRLT